MNHMITEKRESSQDDRLSKLARRIRRRKILTATVLILVTVFVTVALINYKGAKMSTEPPIVLARDRIGDALTDIEVCYSLGFKQVFYQSNYGKNYVEQLWPWEKVEEEPEILSVDQYRQLTEYLNDKYHHESSVSEYFDELQTYEGTILDVQKSGRDVTIYMKGCSYSFVEYEDEVYPLWYDGQLQQPLIVKARIKDNKLHVKEVKEYQLGDGYGWKIYEDFPKPVAIRLNTNLQGSMDTGEKAEDRSKLKAAAYFGKIIAEEKHLEIFLDTGTAEIYYDGPGGRVNIEEKTLEKLKERP